VLILSPSRDSAPLSPTPLVSNIGADGMEDLDMLAEFRL